MHKIKLRGTKILAVILSAAMVMGSTPITVMAEETEITTEQAQNDEPDNGEPVDEPVDEPDDVPDDEPVDNPTDDPADIPVDDPVDTSDNTPDDAPVDTPDDEPVDTPDDTPDDAPTDDPVDVPTDTPTDDPVDTTDETDTTDDNNAETFHVSFLDFSSNVIKEIDVEKDYELQETDFPEAPEVDGYVFVEWENGQGKITEDTAIKAVYKEVEEREEEEIVENMSAATYKVTFLDYKQEEIETVDITSLDELTDDILPEVPDTVDEMEGAEFTGWSVLTDDDDLIELADFIDVGILDKDIRIMAVYEYPVMTLNGSGMEWTVDGTTYNTDDAIQTDYLGGGQYGYLFNDGMLIIDGEGSRHTSNNPYRNNGTSATKVYFTDNVKVIPNYLFYECTNLTGDLVIPDSVETIGHSAFEGCSGFNGSLTLSNSLKKIEIYAFENCSGFTGDLIIPNSVTEIEEEAFMNCSGFNGTLTLSNNLTKVGYWVFIRCSGFTGDLIIPNNITTIEEEAFRDCSGFNGSLVLPDGINIEEEAFMNCSGFTGDLIIPSNTTIGEGAFRDCSGFNGSLVLPDGLNSIESCAFMNCSGLTGELILPDGIINIGGDAFDGCSGLTGNLIIPNSVTEIKGGTFAGCSGFNGSLVLPDNLTKIGRYAFHKCSNLTGDLTIPNSVTEIGECAFYNCSNLTGNLTIPNSVTEIGINTFYNCSGINGTLTLPNVLTKIGSGAFYNCSNLTGDLIIPNSVTEIGGHAFYKCSGFNGILTLSNTLTKIEWGTFYNCSGLTGDLIIPDSVTEIGKTHLDSILLDGGAFDGCTGFNGTLTLSSNLVKIGSSTFANCKNLTGNLVIPNSVTEINADAFYGCNNLTGDLIIPDSVTEIGSGAFQDCSGLTGDLIIPNSVTEIRNSTFYGCSGFDGILTLPNGLTKIGSCAFDGCSSLTGDLMIPDLVTNIDNYAFWDCHNITTIKTSENSQLTTIGDRVFGAGYNNNVKTKLLSNNSALLNYDWNGSRRTVSWTDLDSLTAVYNGSGVYAGSKPSVSDFTVTANYKQVSPNNYDPGTINNIVLDTNDITMTCSNFVAGQDNTVTFNHTAYGTTKSASVVVPVLSIAETNRTLTDLSLTYSGSNVIEGLSPSTSDMTVTGTYHVTYNNGTTDDITETIDINDCTVTNPTATVGTNTITVSYGGKTATATYTGVAKSETGRILTGISLTYSGGDVVEGLRPSVNDMSVTGTYRVTYDNGTTKNITQTVDINDCTVTNPVAVVGTNTITVRYGGRTATATYTGISIAETNRTLTNISLTYSGSNVIEGLSPSTSDMAVTGTYHVTYNNGTTDDITQTIDINDCTVTNPTATVGTNTITVSYGGKTATATYTGVAKSETGRILTGISLTYSGGDVVEGLRPSVNDMSVTGTYRVTYDNGTTKNITQTVDINDCTVTNPVAVVGTNTITVRYGGRTATATYTGIAKTETGRTLTDIKNISYIGGTITEGTNVTITIDDIDFTPVFTVNYNNGTSASVNGTKTECTVISNNTPVTLETTKISVDIKYGNITKTVDIPITVVPRVMIKDVFTRTEATYTGTEAVENTKLVLNKSNLDIKIFFTKYYNNDTTEEHEITENITFTVPDVEAYISKGNNTILVPVTIDDVTRIATVKITGSERQETKREITSLALGTVKKSYTEGHKLTLNDLTANAIYTVYYNNGEKSVTGSALSKDDLTAIGLTIKNPRIKAGRNIITCTYKSDDEIKEVELTVAGTKKAVNNPAPSAPDDSNDKPSVVTPTPVAPTEPVPVPVPIPIPVPVFEIPETIETPVQTTVYEPAVTTEPETIIEEPETEETTTEEPETEITEPETEPETETEIVTEETSEKEQKKHISVWYFIFPILLLLLIIALIIKKIADSTKEDEENEDDEE